MRAAAVCAWLAAVAAFCVVAARWFWHALAPRVVVAPAPAVTDWPAAILAGPALGYSPPATQSELPTAASPAAATEGRIRLLGLAREPGDPEGRQSRALIRIDRRIFWLRQGETLEPGTTLAAIDAEGVRIVASGRELTLPLREPRPQRAGRPPAGASQPPTAPAATTAAAATADTCKLTPEQRTRAYILRPEIIDGVMRERNGWTDLFKPAGVGLLVQNPGGTGAMLGLYGNDILTKADGAQLGSLDDVVRLVLQPLSRNESVVVSGLRSGQPREWIYAGVNCLAR